MSTEQQGLEIPPAVWPPNFIEAVRQHEQEARKTNRNEYLTRFATSVGKWFVGTAFMYAIWHWVVVPAFHAPELSYWDMAWLLFAVRVITRQVIAEVADE